MSDEQQQGIIIGDELTEENTFESAPVRYGFSMAGHHVLQDSDIPTQFSNQYNIQPLPHSVNWFEGLVNQHNTLIPVYNCLKLGEHKKLNNDKNKQYLLTMQFDLDSAGLIIDGMPFPIMGELNEVDSYNKIIPPEIQSSVTGVFKHDGNYWLELSFRELFLTLAGHKDY